MMEVREPLIVSSQGYTGGSQCHVPDKSGFLPHIVGGCRLTVASEQHVDEVAWFLC